MSPARLSEALAKPTLTPAYYRCLHPQAARRLRKTVTPGNSYLWFIECVDCGGRGPSKAPKYRAVKRFEEVGINWRGNPQLKQKAIYGKASF